MRPGLPTPEDTGLSLILAQMPGEVGETYLFGGIVTKEEAVRTAESVR